VLKISNRKKVAVIGAGAMGSALVRGFLKAGLVKPNDLFVSDPRNDAITALAREFPVKTSTDNREAARTGDIVILAVKPAFIKDVLTEISSCLTTAHHLIVSVAAGVTLTFLEANVPPDVPVIRVMPNVPALVGEGMTAISLGKNAGVVEKEEVEKLFAAVGRVVTVAENDLDAVTGISGCGPAYVALILEALADGGVKMGLSRSLAMELAAQTLIGTAKMIQVTGVHPGVLKDQVCSPGGSTIWGVHFLEQGGLRGLLLSAVEAAARRSSDLQSV
jgi:pyrroline-5-carboxylate reductase